MYSYFNGIVKEISYKNIVLEVNNIGYLIIVKNPYLFTIDENITIYIHSYLNKDNVIELYGFLEKEECNLFKQLLTVSGIGPKSALSILASDKVYKIIEAIEKKDDLYLRKFPGIGPKASQQIILDLKGRLNFNLINSNSNQLDAINTLCELGYSKKDAEKIVYKIDANLETKDILKKAFQVINK